MLSGRPDESIEDEAKGVAMEMAYGWPDRWSAEVDMKAKKDLICQIGPGTDMPGGMLSVIEGYLESPYLKEFRQVHVATASSTDKIRCFFRGMARYMGLVMKREVRLAHIHMSERGSCYRAVILVFASRFFRIPVVLHSHGGEMESWYASIGEIRRKIFFLAMRQCQAIIVLTPGWRNYWENIVEGRKIHVIPNCVVAREHAEREYRKSGKLNILYLGYASERKGVFELLKAARILKDKRIDFCLRVGGNGEIDKCRVLIEQLGLQDDVILYGWVVGKEKENLFDISDVLVLPSMYESFGIVLLEAMVHQLPVVCGSNGYSRELIEEGKEGYVAKSGNAKSIAEKLVLLNDRDVLKCIGEAGYKKVVERYSVEPVMCKLAELYSKLLTDKGQKGRQQEGNRF